MNWAASDLADRRELQVTGQDERLLQPEGEAQGSYTGHTRGSVIARLLSFRGWQGLSGDHLPSVDQVVPD